MLEQDGNVEFAVVAFPDEEGIPELVSLSSKESATTFKKRNEAFYAHLGQTLRILPVSDLDRVFRV